MQVRTRGIPFTSLLTSNQSSKRAFSLPRQKIAMKLPPLQFRHSYNWYHLRAAFPWLSDRTSWAWDIKGSSVERGWNLATYSIKVSRCGKRPSYICKGRLTCTWTLYSLLVLEQSFPRKLWVKITERRDFTSCAHSLFRQTSQILAMWNLPKLEIPNRYFSRDKIQHTIDDTKAKAWMLWRYLSYQPFRGGLSASSTTICNLIGPGASHLYGLTNLEVVVRGC